MAEHPDLAARTAELLRTPASSWPMSDAEAATIVAHMRLVDFAQGSALLREGEALRSEYMLLLLEGQVQVDTTGGAQGSDAVAISVLGPGALIGEMSLLDGSPRSATCTAMSPVRAAAITRKALEQLIAQHPAAAARLMVVVAQRLAERLRALGQQLQIYASLGR